MTARRTTTPTCPSVSRAAPAARYRERLGRTRALPNVPRPAVSRWSRPRAPSDLACADLRRRSWYVGWVARDIEIRADCWGLRHFPPRVNESSFVVVFASYDKVVIARNTLDFDEMDRLVADIQCCCGASGQNYRPWREHSEQAMDLAEGRPDTVQKQILTAEVWVRWD